MSIAVHPRFHRQGIARELLATVVHSWSDDCVREAFLEVATDNDAARALYQASGWTRVGRRPGYYRDGCDALILRWAP